MKRLEISRLMDEYVDNEFFPAGGSVADSEAVKGWVLANVKAPVQKKRKPAKKKVRLAVTLAAVMLLLVGAGFPYVQHRLVDGEMIFKQTSDGRITALVHYGPVVEEEGGRLFFNPADGQRLDITDMVSEETPYIYDGSDLDTDLTYYVIMGGTPDFYGCFEWIDAPYPFDDSNGSVEFITGAEKGRCTTYMYFMDGPDRVNDVGGSGMGAVHWEDVLDHAWLLAGLKELDIPYEKTK